MIFPLLNGFMSIRKAPITWVLIFINACVLTYTTIDGKDAQAQLSEVMKNEFFVSTQGQVYAQYLGEHSKSEYPPFLRELGDQVRLGISDRAEFLGQLAFRDTDFMNAADGVEFDGDKVALHHWQKKVLEIRGLQEEHPSFLFGLNANDTSFTKWISYIFVHSGWVHFAGNMLFLMIFGAALEVQIGGLGLLVVFLMSGTVAAGAFSVMTGVTTSPLVGASGAISGIMALYCVLNWKCAERYFYWFFLPFRGFMGFVYLPAWVALVLWAFSDLAGYIGTLPELGGVAHTAHLGGEFAGLVTGLILFFMRKIWPVKKVEPLEAIANRKMLVLMPFVPPIRSTKKSA